MNGETTPIGNDGERNTKRVGRACRVQRSTHCISDGRVRLSRYRRVLAYALPRPERRTERFATGALFDFLLGAGLFTDFLAAAIFTAALFTAASSALGVRRVAHVAQCPSRSARSSRAISSGPSRFVPQ